MAVGAAGNAGIRTDADGRPGSGERGASAYPPPRRAWPGHGCPGRGRDPPGGRADSDELARGPVGEPDLRQPDQAHTGGSRVRCGRVACPGIETDQPCAGAHRRGAARSAGAAPGLTDCPGRRGDTDGAPRVAPQRGPGRGSGDAWTAARNQRRVG